MFIHCWLVNRRENREKSLFVFFIFSSNGQIDGQCLFVLIRFIPCIFVVCVCLYVDVCVCSIFERRKYTWMCVSVCVYKCSSVMRAIGSNQNSKTGSLPDADSVCFKAITRRCSGVRKRPAAQQSSHIFWIFSPTSTELLYLLISSGFYFCSGSRSRRCMSLCTAPPHPCTGNCSCNMCRGSVNIKE